ncbi:golgin subfamily A member 6-like protein 2 [Camellia sinensis]|uniref:golgin subfamily A member 6-like protein 2 n=1 Tax=Camellia sinensis TaxID=4442 RepID=UPI0010359C80|nr:golgin subfamily A member 6-like protein 2 [Camellia sinensis]
MVYLATSSLVAHQTHPFVRDVEDTVEADGGGGDEAGDDALAGGGGERDVDGAGVDGGGGEATDATGGGGEDAGGGDEATGGGGEVDGGGEVVVDAAGGGDVVFVAGEDTGAGDEDILSLYIYRSSYGPRWHGCVAATVMVLGSFSHARGREREIGFSCYCCVSLSCMERECMCERCAVCVMPIIVADMVFDEMSQRDFGFASARW